jgi:hypothetical protein
MRTLLTLGVCGWFVAAAALPAALAQQLSPADTGGLNPIQKEPFDLFQKEPFFLGNEGLDRRYEGLGGGLERLVPPACRPQADESLSSCWLSSVSDFILSYSLSSDRESQIRQQLQRSLLFSVGNIQGSSPGKGDFWKPGEFDRLIGR